MNISNIYFIVNDFLHPADKSRLFTACIKISGRLSALSEHDGGRGYGCDGIPQARHGVALLGICENRLLKAIWDERIQDIFSWRRTRRYFL
ncbi:MAG: hypothetical protein RBQ88_09160 [Desulfobulbus oligotrophicus]|jgi:hypothetical protein|nr:hypothetical protein [Desulfobulbus oligotrophicus]